MFLRLENSGSLWLSEIGEYQKALKFFIWDILLTCTGLLMMEVYTRKTERKHNHIYLLEPKFQAFMR